MRKGFILLCTLSVLAFMGCQQAPEVEKSPQQETSTATITINENPNASSQTQTEETVKENTQP